jgi:molecular chaperone GrpE
MAETNPRPNGNGADVEQRGASAVLDDLEALKARASQAEQERDQFLALLQRTRADFENYEKRVLRDHAQERRFMHAGLAKDLLPVIDNLDRAVEAATQAGEQGPLVQGVALVKGQLLDALKRHGITVIEAVGQPFDPARHEAVMQRPAPGKQPGTVLQVAEQGFTIHDRVLRPAKVIVAA